VVFGRRLPGRRHEHVVQEDFLGWQRPGPVEVQ